ncbi:MAG: TIGR01212 family radical SAM protein [Clostridiaceae bacterium]|nr:TIGR01212 family radical SAM protein [Clostridiaceae bacterium]
MLYYKFSDYLVKTYHEKVYKIPVNIPVNCPNRDGTISVEGCVFCGDEGAGFETLSPDIPVREQLKRNIGYIGEKYGAKKYIAYFQNYTNTYCPAEQFREYLLQAVMDDVVALYVSTRPDCLGNEYLEIMSEIQGGRNVDIVVEIGLQSVNNRTLSTLNRGHTVADFIDSVLRAKRYGLKTCAHMITDIPMDSIDDVIEGARILSALDVDQVKCHSLYILKDTKLGEWYSKGLFKPLDKTEFIERTIMFLEYLSKDIVIQRLIGRAPEERCLFCNWNTSWWKIVGEIEDIMKQQNRYQGKKARFGLKPLPEG